MVDNFKVHQKKEETLKLSVKEGSATSFMSGAGDAYIVPYSLALNATNTQVGFLSSFVGFIGASSQLFGSKLMYKYSRKKIITTFVLLQSLMWMVILSLGFFYIRNTLSKYIIPLLILFYTIYAVFGSLAGPAWFSLMGDLVSENKRDFYFSLRNRTVGFVAIIITFIASFFLDYMKEIGLVIIGFMILFGVAALGRFISFLYFLEHYYPKIKLKKEKYFSFFQFIKKAPGNNFGKFSFYVGFVSLTVSFAGPFFAVYMLKDLQFSYIWFTAVTMSAGIFAILSMPVFGKIGDKYGNRQLLKIGAFLTPLIPFFWLVSKNPIFLILTSQLVSGLGWSAFNLGASNFIYDSVSKQRRGICVAYFTMINGIAVFIGAGIGGIIAGHVKISFMNIFLFIFLISGIGRILVNLIFLPKIKEVKVLPQNNGKLNLFDYVSLFMPQSIHSLFRGVKENVAVVFNYRKNEF